MLAGQSTAAFHSCSGRLSAAKLVQLQLALQLQEGFQAVHLSGFAAEYDLN
jgi:hypothetical protein